MNEQRKDVITHMADYDGGPLCGKSLLGTLQATSSAWSVVNCPECLALKEKANPLLSGITNPRQHKAISDALKLQDPIEEEEELLPINRITSPYQECVYRRAIEKWGVQDMKDMVAGEIGELLTLFGRDVQGRATKDDWLEEIADVIIVLGELAMIKGVASDLDDMIDKKLNKLKNKLD